MKKENFTTSRISAFKCADGKQQSIFWDAKVPGLGMRVTKGGARSYIFETRLNGKTLRITIGDERSYSIAEAQKEATELKANTNKLIDPRELETNKRNEHEARRSREKSLTQNLLAPWTEYISECTQRVRDPWGQRHIDDHERMSALGGSPRKRGSGLTQDGMLRPLLLLSMKDLTQSAIINWLQDNSKTRPTQTALAYRLLRAFYNWLLEHELYGKLVSEDFLITKKVKSNIPKVLPRKIAMQKEQLAGWFRAVQSLPSHVQQVYLQALLITGARREELAELKWDRVDFKNKVIEIKDKIDDSGLRIIPLTPYVSNMLIELKAELLRELSARNHRYKTQEKLSVYVFSSTSTRGYIVSPTNRIYTEALQREGLEHLAAHDLRRSFATMGEEADVSDGVIKQIMGHKPKSGDTTEAHYKVRTIGRLRDKHIEIENWILEHAGIKQPKIDTNQHIVTLVK